MQENENAGKNRFGLVTYEYLKETKALARKIESLESQITKQRQKVQEVGLGKDCRLFERYKKKLTDLENQKSAVDVDYGQRRNVIKAWLDILGSEWDENMKKACYAFYIENENQYEVCEKYYITNISARTYELFNKKYWCKKTQSECGYT
ncbi:MAG: hypothetical protein LUH58_00445 [Lachnospiraceae bacterium]|nr:hypothetical protein [Lachnospiraceae bacterium]